MGINEKTCIPTPLKRTFNAIVALLLSTCLVISQVGAFEAYAIGGKSLDDTIVEPVRDQLVEVIVQSITPDGTPTSASPTGYLNFCDATELPFGIPSFDGTYSMPDNASELIPDGALNYTCILYSFGAEPHIVISDENGSLKAGVDYRVDFSNNKNVGMATATIVGLGEYAGSSKQIDFEIVGYSYVGYNKSTLDDTYSCDWGPVATWPGSPNPGSGGRTGIALPVVKEAGKDSYVAFSKTSANGNNYYDLAIDDPMTLKPWVSVSEDDKEYCEIVSSSLRRFSVPPNTGRLTLSEYGKSAYPTMRDWELSKVHFNLQPWGTGTTTAALSKFFTIKATHPIYPTLSTASPWLIYRGEEATKATAARILSDIYYTCTPSALLATALKSGLGMSDDEITTLVSSSTERSGDMTITTKVNSNTCSTNLVFTLSDSGIVQLMNSLVAQGYASKDMIIDPSDVVMSGQTMTLYIKPYDLTNDVDGEYTGTWTAVTSSQIKNLEGDLGIITSGSEVPHGSSIDVNHQNPVALIGESINLADVACITPTGLPESEQYNILADQQSVGYYILAYQVKEPGSSEWVDTEQIDSPGEYRLTITGTAPKYNQLGKYSYFTGSNSATFTVANPVCDSATLGTLKAALDSASIDEDLIVVDDSTDAAKLQGIDSVPSGSKYILKSDSDAMEKAIDDAKSVYWNAESTNDQVTAATTALTSAKDAYAKAVVGPVAVDKAALNTNIADAEAALAAAKVSVDGTDVEVGQKWITEENKVKLQGLIDAAKAVNESSTVSQKDVNLASTNLDTARIEYIRLVGAATADQIKALEDAKAAAEQHKATLDADSSLKKIAADDVANQPNGTKYVLQTDYDALSAAITEAEGLLADAHRDSLTGAETEASVSKLNSAVTACQVKTASIDTSKLDSAIKAANTARTGVVASDDGAGVEPGQKWAPKAAIDAMDAAIAKATGVQGNASATQAEVDAAVAEMTAATSTFAGAVQTAATPSLEDAVITGCDDYEAESADEVVTVTPKVTLNGEALVAGTDYTASMRSVAGAVVPANLDEATGAYSFSINQAGTYNLTVTGAGSYSKSKTATFKVTYPQDTAVQEGVSLETSADAKNRVRITAYVDGKEAEVLAARSSDTDIAGVNMQDGTALVAGVNPGKVTISVQVKTDSGTEEAEMQFVSTTSTSGSATSTATIADEASGVKMAGLPDDLKRDLTLLVKTGNDVGKMSQIANTGKQKSLGMFDVKLLLNGQEVQPLGSIDVGLPVDLDGVEDDMKVVAYHWHGSTNTPKVYDATHSKVTDQAYVTVPVAELSAFEAGYVPTTLATDTNPGSDPEGSGDNGSNDGNNGGDDQNGNLNQGGNQGGNLNYGDGSGNGNGNGNGQGNGSLSNGSGNGSGSGSGSGATNGSLAQTGDAVPLAALLGIIMLAAIVAGVIWTARRGDSCERRYR